MAVQFSLDEEIKKGERKIRRAVADEGRRLAKGEVQVDGWQNLLTGMGHKSTDKFENSSFVLSEILDPQTLTDIYRGEGLGAKVVDIPAMDAIRNWFSVDGDTDDAIVKALDKLRFRPAVEEAKKWARLYGGSVIVLGIDDGPVSKRYGDKVFEQPLREESINKLAFFRVYPRQQVMWDPNDLESNPSNPNYGWPNKYEILPVNAVPGAMPFKVHVSRLLRFDGIVLPEQVRIQNMGWGDSVIQRIYTRLRGFAASLVASESIIDEFTIGILKIKNLGDLLAAKEGGKLIQERLRQIDLSKRVLNTMLTDVEEDYTRLSATVNGIKDILEFLKDVYSAESGIPQVKLFGEQTKGIGGEAAGNIRMYYDDISYEQESRDRPQYARVVDLLLKSKDFQEAAKNIDRAKAHVRFKSLWQESAKEQAEARNLTAQSDEKYLKYGVLSPAEVADSRFGGGTYSMETRLTEGAKREEKAKPMLGGGKDGGEGAADKGAKKE